MHEQRSKDEELVKQAVDITHGLSRWESKFIGSVWDRVMDFRRELTDNQRAKLTEILERYDE